MKVKSTFYLNSNQDIKNNSEQIMLLENHHLLIYLRKRDPNWISIVANGVFS